MAQNCQLVKVDDTLESAVPQFLKFKEQFRGKGEESLCLTRVLFVRYFSVIQYNVINVFNDLSLSASLALSLSPLSPSLPVSLD